MASEEGPITVVVADDDALLVRVLSNLLEMDGRFRLVAAAYDGAEVVDAVVTHRPDLAVLDVAMPVLSGLEATRRIRALSPATTVVLISGLEEPDLAEQAAAAGAAAFVAKDRSAVDLPDLAASLISS